MSVLATLPRCDQYAWGLMQARVRTSVDRATRARWGTWLLQELHAGRISAEDALKAIAEGVRGFAQLFREAPPPALAPLPQFTRKTLPDAVSNAHTNVPSDILRACVDVVGALARDDAALRRKLSQITPSPDFAGDLLSLGQEGWRARIERVTHRAFRREWLKNCESLYALIPTPLVQLKDYLGGHSYGVSGWESDAPAFSLLVDRGHFLGTCIPINPVSDPEAYRDFIAAWNALCNRQRFPVLENLQSFEHSPHYLLEVLGDMALKGVKDQEGKWHLPADEWGNLELETGFCKEVHGEDIGIFMEWFRAQSAALKMRKGRGHANHTSSGRGIRPLIATLSALAEILRADTTPKTKRTHTILANNDQPWLGSIELLPQYTGIDGALHQWMTADLDSGEYDMHCYLLPEKQDPVELLRLADSAIINYTAATIATEEVHRYGSTKR